MLESTVGRTTLALNPRDESARAGIRTRVKGMRVLYDGPLHHASWRFAESPPVFRLTGGHVHGIVLETEMDAARRFSLHFQRTLPDPASYAVGTSAAHEPPPATPNLCLARAHLRHGKPSRLVLR